MLIRDAPGSGPVMPELHRRMRWVVVGVVVAFALLVGRLWQLQVVRGERYFERARANVVAKRYVGAVRGKILDRNGAPLASNRPAFNIYVIPKLFDRTTRARLIRLLGLDDEEQAQMDKLVALGAKRSMVVPVQILEDQGRDRAALIRQASFQLPGVEVRDEAYRFYPNGELAAHLIGYLNKMTAEELANNTVEGYDESDLVGRYGLEREWENYLRGKKGSEAFVVNAKGQRVDDAEGLLDGPRFVPPVPGHNLVLTIDAELQKLAEKAVEKHPAAAVAVLEVHTGRILALVSKPSFNPNTMTGHLSRAEFDLLLSDPRKPFIDKTLRQHYPPGSTFKFVTAIAALEDGNVSEEEKLHCPGYHEQGKRTFSCTHQHNKVNMVEAIQRSCNVYFWKLAERVGIDRMAEVAHDFGFGAPTGLGLNGDVPGRIPTRAWYEQFTTFKIGYTLNAATGQGDVEVTVLQLAAAYAALVNGGKLYVPQVVLRVDTHSGEAIIRHQPKLRRKVKVSSETLDLLRQGMHRVVNAEGGTAYELGHSDEIDFGGKTGTAQARGKRSKERQAYKGWHPYRDHAWFAGYAPASDPKVAIVVLIEHGGPGGKVAAPVGRRILEGYFAKIKPKQPSYVPPPKPAAKKAPRGGAP